MFIHDEPYFTKPFANHSPKLVIPTGDVGAYQFYIKHRWVYNKLELYQTLGYEAFPHGVPITKFPVFSKPIYNLFGMSMNAKAVFSADEHEYTAGHLWMPVFYGRHISTDYALLDGKIVWSYSMSGHKDEKGSFTHWHFTNSLQQHEIEWVEEHMTGFTGIINIESIGSKIIEVHLRCSTQFVDLYGNDFIAAMIDLYENKIWSKVERATPGYSFVVRIDKSEAVENKSLKFNFPSTDKVQIYYTVDENEPLSQFVDNDPYSYRIAVVNGNNIYECKKMAQNIEDDVKKQLGL